MGNSKQKIEDIKKKYKVDQIWSWSKFNLYQSDKYSFYLRYILRKMEDRANSIYGEAGTCAHEILENFYNDKIKYDDMANLYKDGLMEFAIKGLKYNRSNEELNNKIGRRYEECVSYFFNHHKVIPSKVRSEIFIITWINKYLFQGYVDAVHKEDDNYVITDWKTSTIYTGEKLEKEKGQLMIYAIAWLNKGVKLENIKLRWNFLKYVNVETNLANGNKKDRVILRNDLGRSLVSNAMMWMKKYKYPIEDITGYVNKLVKSNNIASLPKDIREKYAIDDCYIYVEPTESDIKGFKDYVVEVLSDANRRINVYSKDKDESIWWQDVSNDYSYFMANLSGYSAKIHKPYAKYLEALRLAKEKERLSREEDDKWLNDLP